MSEDRAAAPMPWEGDAQRVDIFLVAAIAVSSIYKLALIPLTPTWVNSHPMWLEILKGSISGMVVMGAKAKIGEASLFVAVVAAIPGLMMFNWIFWWAGRRWGRRAIDFFLGNHPKAEQRAARLERLVHRFGWIAVVIAWFQPVPNALIYAAAGWTRMRLWVFVLLDLIGSLLWIAFCVGLGYIIGQSAVDIAKAVGRYALYVTIALIVVVFARQYYTASRRRPT